MTTPDSLSADATNSLRSVLLEFLRGGSAHVDPRTALSGLAPQYLDARPDEAPHTPWQLLEHLRFTLHDLLEFCTNSNYTAPTWPDDYWPVSEAPHDPKAWEIATDAFLGDLTAFEALVENPATDLDAPIPWGQGQTILREVLLAVDHTSYHLGQLVLIRKQLGAWRD